MIMAVKKNTKAASKKNVSSKPNEEKQTKVSTTDLPRKTIEDCLRVANAIFENYGDSASFDELAVAVKLSPKNVVFKYLVWGAQAYGLVIKSGDVYNLTETSKKIFQPENAVQKRESIIKAILIPTILSRFYSDFNGKLLPDNEYFGNILITRYDVPRERVEVAETILIENARFAGILTQHESGKQIIRLDGAPARVLESQEIDTVEIEAGKKSTFDKVDKLCFYITPIGEDGTEIRKHADMFLKHLIEPAFEIFGYKVVRADKIEKSGIISQQIFEMLVQSQICVADLSYGNPNAFYELGVRHMIKKPTIQIIRKGDKIPFDVSQGRTIIVDVSDIFTLMDKIDSAKKELIEHIKGILDPKATSQSDDNPVSIYLPNLTVKL
jgi:hypothetical protein